MISAIAISALIVGYLAVFVTLLVGSVEAEAPMRWFLAIAVWLIAGIAVVIYAAEQESDKGPCLKEETRYMLVGEVMTPYTACVERGTWQEGAS